MVRGVARQVHMQKYMYLSLTKCLMNSGYRKEVIIMINCAIYKAIV